MIVSFLERLQRIDALDQRRFSRSRWAADHHHLALGDARGAILQRLRSARTICDVADLDHRGSVNVRRRCGLQAPDAERGKLEITK